VQRLFSTFPSGFPGAGLVLVRVVTAIPLLHAALLRADSPPADILKLVMAGPAILLLIGLWTPVAAAAIVVVEVGIALSHPSDPWVSVHFGMLAAALAMLGPGGCSIDARLF
jgi:putative oxidoreductase